MEMVKLSNDQVTKFNDSWLFVNVLDFGINGAMGSLCISSWFVVFGEFIYIFGGWCADSWKGFTVASLKDILPVVKLSISSGFMVCLEMWYYAILVLIAGYMKNAEVSISAFSVCININGWEFMICLGLLGAACVRVANELGRGDAKAVVFSIKVVLSTTVTLGVFFWILCLVFGKKIGYLFSNDESVVQTVSDLSVLLAFSMLFNSVYPVFSGVAVGAGLQARVAIINFVCFYLVGLPIGLILGYVTSLQVKSYGQFNPRESAQPPGEKGDLKGRVCQESKKIWRVALPSVISRVASFGTLVVTQSFVGHISSVDLAGYALVQTLIVRFVNGALIGMSSATETLCGQAFGAKQHHMMGIFLQRSWFVDLVTLTILLPVFIFATSIFKLLGEDEAVAKSAGYISLWFIPFCYSLVFALTIQMYLQAQQKNMVIGWLALTQFVLHVPLSWLFVNVLDFGIDGAMGSLCISSWFVVFGEFIYIFGGWCADSWKGFTVASLKDILPVVKLSISSGFMICLEMWYYAILVLIAGYMKNAEVSISAFSVCININGWEFMICLGLLGAACVRVANELGRGDAKAVVFSIKVVLSTTVTLGVFFWILCLVFGKKIGYLFSNDESVVHTVSDLSVLLAFSMLFNSVYPVFSGVAVGAGLQARVAIINFVCFYLVGLPIGLILGYVTSLQVKGIWIGMLCGVITETLALSIMMWRINWDEEVLFFRLAAPINFFDRFISRLWSGLGLI
ncbi:protein TRANSPARENT TESTA 12-like [Dorcoceras hygrometricum]|uniref:Protein DETOXIFICATION n=1 Tax=Dorcoceras hygrometricum TaxID=472368 RepID=A0A2Z7CNW9_9LAMI|nr:protein TRANSPARENT TESTA 12-like [Dorcoceras hygrometricum]